MTINWIGKTTTTSDLITRVPVSGLAAILDENEPELIVPPLWHWVFFLSPTRMKDIGSDGHARHDTLLPPSRLPRRMRAGGRFTFSKLLKIGEQAERVSTVEDIQVKTGTSGELEFVTIHHEITGDRGAQITEIENIVYREAPVFRVSSPKRRGVDQIPQWTKTITPDPVLLFKYSAATMNSHRIHFDRTYATEIEGYPGLVVHGPLAATMLLSLVVEHVSDVVVTEFSYSAIRPLFDLESFRLNGRVDGDTATLWITDSSGAMALTARAGLRKFCVN